jgi:hypothetical protein
VEAVWARAAAARLRRRGLGSSPRAELATSGARGSRRSDGKSSRPLGYPAHVLEKQEDGLHRSSRERVQVWVGAGARVRVEQQFWSSGQARSQLLGSLRTCAVRCTESAGGGSPESPECLQQGGLGSEDVAWGTLDARRELRSRLASQHWLEQANLRGGVAGAKAGNGVPMHERATVSRFLARSRHAARCM